MIIILLAYFIFASIFGFAYRFAINPDGLSYLRLAEYIAEGNFKQSVAGTWSPLFPWLMAPFLYIGFEGLVSARIAIALSGAGVLVGSWLLSLRFNVPQNLRFVALLIAALLTADWSIQNIGPELLITTLIIFYLYLVTDPDILEYKRAAVICGTVGGMAYFAKHYAFWFFLVHFPLVLVLKAYIDRYNNRSTFKKAFVSLVTGMTVFLMVSSIWIMVMSAKFERLTISPSGKLAHAKVGPPDADRREPSFIGLHKPINSYAMHPFEDDSQIAYEFKTWSPFESKEYFMYELKLIKKNIIYIVGHFINNSPFFTYAFVIGILTLIPIALLINPLTSEKKFLYGWTILSSGVYCSGHLLTFARGIKYFYPVMILVFFLYIHFIEEVKNGMREIKLVSGMRMKLLSLYLIMLIVLAFSIKPGWHLLKSIKNIIAIEQVNPYKEIAGQIRTIEFPAPYAIIRSSQKSYTDLYIAYYLKKQLTGRPLSDDIEGITKELRSADAKSLLVFDNLAIAGQLKNDSRYLFLGSKKLKKDERYWHVPYIERDEITAWDEEVNVFELK